MRARIRQAVGRVFAAYTELAGSQGLVSESGQSKLLLRSVISAEIPCAGCSVIFYFFHMVQSNKSSNGTNSRSRRTGSIVVRIKRTGYLWEISLIYLVLFHPFTSFCLGRDLLLVHRFVPWIDNLGCWLRGYLHDQTCLPYTQTETRSRGDKRYRRNFS